jgi:hypothetical protein
MTVTRPGVIQKMHDTHWRSISFLTANEMPGPTKQ